MPRPPCSLSSLALLPILDFFKHFSLIHGSHYSGYQAITAQYETGTLMISSEACYYQGFPQIILRHGY